MKSNQIHFEEIFAPTYPTNSKKILFACTPADGHFSPMTGIAKQLQFAGYDVRWYTSVSYEKKLEKLQIQHYPFKEALELTADNVDKVFPERVAIKNPVQKLNFDIINFFIKRGPEYYADISDIYLSFPFDLVVADCAFTGIPFITDKMKIPVLTVGVFPLTETSKDLAAYGLGITPAHSFIGKRKQALSRFIANRIMFRKSNKVLKQMLSKYSITIDNMNLFDVLVKKSTLFLQSGTPGFEYYRRDLSKNIRFIGPLLPYTSEREMPEWFDGRLFAYKKVILVTQGTVEKDINKLLIPALEAFRYSDTLVIATTGGSQTELLKSRFPERNFIIEDFIPFADVMPYASAYISNGGYGGVMLGITYQLPMIVAGVHEGKNEINARVGYFNLGINLKTERPTALQIRAAVQEVSANMIYKENVIKLGKEFNTFNTGKLCETYVREILGKTKKLLPSSDLHFNRN